ncbi:MAG TPA: family 65 glycosyl hydrolase, partial [Lachnospiraceae bacterium]|nr:family 65 glycosyl hydrolase [Lachnospiraceae bacterium]
ASIEEGETVTLTKFTVFSDSIRCKDCLQGAMEEMEKALKLSLPVLYQYQKEYLKEYWNHCFLEIEGDDDLTAAVNYNMYQLIQSVGKDEYCNIAAKGLSGEGYEGHYFWDTEMYIQPFFNLTEPGITKNLISFRYRTLEKARENARILGHRKGALYPWRTIMGTECSGYYPSGSAGYHINGDIAYSVVAYYLSTKDIEFIVEKGAEILFETARLWMDVGNYYNGSFRINCVTGPDEYTCMVNNNYYTNVCAQFNLNWAVKFYRLLKEEKKLSPVAEKIHLTEEEIKEFDQAARNMYLPYDEKLKINPQDDSFLQKKVWDLEHTPKEKFPLLLHYHPLHLYRYQVCKQADTVLAHFIFEDAQSLETIRNSFDYYEKITTHDSSLSTCIFSIVASKLGRTEKAYEYFGDSAKLDLFNTHKNTKDGIHTANMGGNYMAIIYGFAGLRIKEDGLHFAPSIPKQWKEYRFKINYEDSQIFVEINSEESKFSLLKGSPKQVVIRGKRYELKDTLVV